jgi:hypothetical protein
MRLTDRPTDGGNKLAQELRHRRQGGFLVGYVVSGSRFLRVSVAEYHAVASLPDQDPRGSSMPIRGAACMPTAASPQRAVQPPSTTNV